MDPPSSRRLARRASSCRAGVRRYPTCRRGPPAEVARAAAAPRTSRLLFRPLARLAAAPRPPPPANSVAPAKTPRRAGSARGWWTGNMLARTARSTLSTPRDSFLWRCSLLDGVAAISWFRLLSGAAAHSDSARLLFATTGPDGDLRRRLQADAARSAAALRQA